MNAWRWMGVFLLVAGLTTFGVSASGQDKDKTTQKKGATTVKTTEKKTGTTEKKAQTTEKKAETTEKKTEPAVKAGELAPKALEGKDVFYQTLETTTTQNMVVNQMKHTQEQKQTFYFSWTPKGKTDDKYTVVQKILDIKMDIDIAGNKISYDSTAATQPKNPMSEFFKQLKGAEFTLVISKNKDGRYVVDDVKGVSDLVTKLSSVNKSMEPLLKKILNADTVKQMAEPMLGVVPPNGAVPKSGSWTSTNTLNMGPIGKYETTNTYTPEEKGKVKGLLPIQVKTELKYTAPDANQKALPFQITKAELKSKESGGTVWFNTDKGRVDKAELTVKLTGTLTIDIANMATDVTLDQTQVSKLRTSDSNPVPATPASK